MRPSAKKSTQSRTPSSKSSTGGVAVKRGCSPAIRFPQQSESPAMSILSASNQASPQSTSQLPTNSTGQSDDNGLTASQSRTSLQQSDQSQSNLRYDTSHASPHGSEVTDNGRMYDVHGDVGDGDVGDVASVGITSRLLTTSQHLNSPMSSKDRESASADTPNQVSNTLTTSARGVMSSADIVLDTQRRPVLSAFMRNCSSKRLVKSPGGTIRGGEVRV